MIFETKSGPVVLEAKVIVDCTGDGDTCLCRHHMKWVEEDSLTQPMTLLLMKIFRAAFEEYVRQNPDQEWCKGFRH